MSELKFSCMEIFESVSTMENSGSRSNSDDERESKSLPRSTAEYWATLAEKNHVNFSGLNEVLGGLKFIEGIDESMQSAML